MDACSGSAERVIMWLVLPCLPCQVTADTLVTVCGRYV